jgi:hypothetical protein
MAALVALGGCAAAGGPARVGNHSNAPRADSTTIALWRFDETTGTRFVDAGPLRLDGEAGIDTRTDFGRFGQAREFIRTIDSFGYVPHAAALDPPRALTIEAWLYVKAFGQYELTPIIGRWSEEANTQSWLFALGGQRLLPPTARLASPGFFLGLVPLRRLGHLMFFYQPADASTPRTFTSARPVETLRWTHVAVTFDGDIVKLWIDGELDSQFATRGAIRATPSPILMANYFDPRRLTGFGGDVRIIGGDNNPYYAYEGLIDELRISNVAREVFPTRFAP